MASFLIGFSIGVFVAALLNARYRQNPRWIQTRSLVIIAMILLVAGIIELMSPGSLPKL